MAFQQYPDSIAVNVILADAPHVGSIGPIEPDENQQLQIMRVMIFKRGLQPTVRMRVKAYVSDVLVATSEDVLVSDIEDLYSTTDNFIGWVCFSFTPRFNLNAGSTTMFHVELTNYTYVAGTTYIGLVRDWPVTMGFNSDPGSVNTAPIAIELYGAI